MQTDKIIAHITDWLRDYCERNKQIGFVVGVSGGIDSAVTSSLCSRTGLPVLCVEMPIHQSPAQVQRAQDHIAMLMRDFPKVRMETVKLTPVFDALVTAMPKIEEEHLLHLSLANTRARLRMTTLYYFAGIHRSLVAGTGNKVEDFGVGFFTKYGDGGVDLSPIADLNKTQVYEVARALGVIDSILQAPPTDGLWGDDRNDADQIGATYPELEWAMELRESTSDTSSISARQQEVLAIYDRMHAANQHKMVAIPVCSIPPELKH